MHHEKQAALSQQQGHDLVSVLNSNRGTYVTIGIKGAGKRYAGLGVRRGGKEPSASNHNPPSRTPDVTSLLRNDSLGDDVSLSMYSGRGSSFRDRLFAHWLLLLPEHCVLAGHPSLECSIELCAQCQHAQVIALLCAGDVSLLLESLAFEAIKALSPFFDFCHSAIARCSGGCGFLGHGD